MRRWSPPPALGRVPDDVTEPFTVIFWGITTERVQEWLADSDTRRRTARDRRLTGQSSRVGPA